MSSAAGGRVLRYSSAEELAKRKYLRPREFCVLYGRSRSWLAKAIREKTIESVKVGGGRMICAESAAALFRGGLDV